MSKGRDAVAWMVGNPVAANLVMIVLLVGGLISASYVKQEVFPEYEIDLVSISIPYPGASPAEVEQGIILAVEEQVRGLDGVKRVTALATEGSAAVSVELVSGSDSNKVVQDIKNGIDRITSFPQDSERPVVRLVTNRREVISLVIYGDLDEYILHGLSEKIRDEILLDPGITNVDISGLRPLEISIEVPQEKLRAYDLTLDEIAATIRRTAVELPAGGVKTRGGEILLRTAERRDYGRQFDNIIVVTRPDGAQVRLSEIATIKDGFRDTDQSARYNGKPAVQISISRVGKQKPIEIAEKVKIYAEDLKQRLPEEVGVATWIDASEVYSDRVDLLQRNALLGLTLVLIILGLFLEIRLAFWVMMGIPISVLGSFLLFPSFAVSINMISLFAFIITLGIVVDDAVVVGENIFEKRQEGLSYIEAAIKGAKEVAMPVCFSIATNIVAFAPMLFIPGFSGKIFRVVPVIVISVFLISLLESLFILPAHLGHMKPGPKTGFRAKLRNGQRRFAQMLQAFIDKIYQPQLLWAIHYRYLTLVIGIVILMIMVGGIAGGFIRFSFMPKIDSDDVDANATLTFGSPVEDTQKVAERLEQAALEVMDANGGREISRGILTLVGTKPPGGGGPTGGGAGSSGSHLANVEVLLVPTDFRPITSSEFVNKWREQVGDLPGLESLSFDFSTGPGDIAIDIQLTHRDIKVLEKAAAEMAEALESYNGVIDVNDGFSEGKPQFDFKVKPEARALGITATDLGRQLRDAFYGNRAIRQQRGRQEIWVMVRLPEDERQSEFHIGDLLVRTPGGGEIPLSEAAEVSRNRAYTEIKRTDGKRVINVTADVQAGVANGNQVLADISQTVLPGLLAKYDGLGYSLEGENRSQRESLDSLKIGFIMAMMVIYALLAIPFRSYFQPMIVMAAIPFGMVGAVIGHLLLGFELSVISMMGIIALSGVVVNDSLVLIHMTNELRAKGKTAKDAVRIAGMRRFRPILLTSLTTFFGLAPMMLETSVQARFLVPMAISLGFGILVATFIILLLVPALYIILEDLGRIWASIKGLYSSEPEPERSEA